VRSKTRTVLINAGPWLPIPPDGYGGIENVVASLVPELRARGWRVELATVGESTLEVDARLAVFDRGQFHHVTGPYNQMIGIAHSHMLAVLERLRESEPVDLVHDHLEVVGPSTLAALDGGAPPALQTLHWDLKKHPDFYERFDGRGRVFFNGVSESQLAEAPENLRRQALGAVPLAVDLDQHPFVPDKGDYYLSLARITWNKGIDIAARLCKELGLRLVIAGPVAGLDDAEQLAEALADPDSPVREYPDVRYHQESLAPFIDGDRIRWVGTVQGREKRRLVGRARALVVPLRWSEPGGTAVVEALASGTPVIGLGRGVLPSLIEHGVNGFLADDERELADYLPRAGEIDPSACRRTVEENYTAPAMADAYVRLYDEVLERTACVAP
jgi:glycosyltransferase involved in cell wall biosynthesis